ncbi:glycoside hydrolase superfamily [Microdochium trichocladiopsis]|uniref:alpha-galactosidase n=1 Tax=Microdochium trichocladiopsis TaxID=1682393 RepID=A0A9P8Y0I5_9PEZI|nr:glycoside hydrolase superfamily [Microdochium trichocladiopsis]KAH7024592.1 glycoside hydrolase superfamily [Microdochium trichocladiopsis]
MRHLDKLAGQGFVHPLGTWALIKPTVSSRDIADCDTAASTDFTKPINCILPIPAMLPLSSINTLLLLIASITHSAIATDAASVAPWRPTPGTPWQIILGGKINPSSPFIKQVSVVDGDLFTNTNNGADPKTIFGALHAQGKKIICYFSAGTYEPYRPDSGQYDKRDLGATLPEWPDERWVDIRSERVRAIIRARIELAAKMGCDGIDPDNMDGYANQNGGGFNPPLRKQDSIDLVRMMASHASSLGMATGLKNALAIIADVVDVVHFAVNEECASYNECTAMKPFIAKGKAVFHVEYPPAAGSDAGVATAAKRKKYCQPKGGEGFSTLIKTYDLDKWTQTCDGRVYKS